MLLRAILAVAALASALPPPRRITRTARSASSYRLARAGRPMCSPARWARNCAKHSASRSSWKIAPAPAPSSGRPRSRAQIVWAADRDGRATYYNRRWFEYTGQSVGRRARTAGRSPCTRRPPCRGREARETLASGDAFEVEYRFRAADGTYRWHLGRAVPIRGAEGAIDFWIGTATDIHDHKRTQQAQRFLLEAGELLGTSLALPRHPRGGRARGRSRRRRLGGRAHRQRRGRASGRARARRRAEDRLRRGAAGALSAERAERRRRGDPHRQVAVRRRADRRDAAPRRGRRAALRPDPRARARVVRLRAAHRSGPGAGRDHTGDRRVGPPLRRDRPPLRRGARPARCHGDRERTPLPDGRRAGAGLAGARGGRRRRRARRPGRDRAALEPGGRADHGLRARRRARPADRGRRPGLGAARPADPGQR